MTGEVFELIYWPGDPGRAEHIRLALEYAGAKYIDTALSKDALTTVLAQISDDQLGDSLNPPCYAPPILRHGQLAINQTPNVLLYLGPKLGLVPGIDENPNNLFRVNALALSALDGLSNEVHNCHHPISTSLYYEEQKDESIRASTAWVTKRLPIFLAYFQKVLSGEASGQGPWLFGGKTSYADLVLYHCIVGTSFQFPKAMAAMRDSGRFGKVFELVEAVENLPNVKAYLASDRRQKFGAGIYRDYPDLDVLPTSTRSRADDIKEYEKMVE